MWIYSKKHVRNLYGKSFKLIQMKGWKSLTQTIAYWNRNFQATISINPKTTTNTTVDIDWILSRVYRRLNISSKSKQTKKSFKTDWGSEVENEEREKKKISIQCIFISIIFVSFHCSLAYNFHLLFIICCRKYGTCRIVIMNDG